MEIPVRALALVSGVVGLLAGAFLVGFFALEPFGVRLGSVSLGTVNDVLGVVQFATLAPVARALGRRLPATPLVRVATVIGLVAMVAFAVLGVLLVEGVLTFDAQIGPVIATIVAVFGWLLTVNLVGHRTHTLPRPVTRVGVLLGAAVLVAMVLVAAAWLLPGVAGRVAQGVGYGLGGAAWLALPAYVLLLAARVFGSSPPAAAPAESNLSQGALRP